MVSLEDLLKELYFTQYEAQTLATLIRYNVLSASEMYKYSGVPQPKIYETMNNLKEKGLIEIIPKGRKKLFRVKPREIIQEHLLNYTRKIDEIGKNSIRIIDKIYNSEETEDIPFIGIAGKDRIQEYINILIDTAQKSFVSYFPAIYYNDGIVSLIQEKYTSINIKLIFHDNEKIQPLKNKLSFIEIYYVKSNIFESINSIFGNIEQFLTPENRESFGFGIIKKIAINLQDIFGLAIIDREKSLFKLPLPIDTPMAVMSTLTDIVQFHCQAIDEILENTVRV
jgi:sugar-specific transcriptional regulator TrmB